MLARQVFISLEAILHWVVASLKQTKRRTQGVFGRTIHQAAKPSPIFFHRNTSVCRKKKTFHLTYHDWLQNPVVNKVEVFSIRTDTSLSNNVFE